MRPALLPAALLVAASVLAGCSADPTADPASTATEEYGVTAGDGKGVLLGVVVDEGIHPVKGVSVALAMPDGSARNATSDTEGRFAFGDLEPGTYILTATHLLYAEAKSSAEVVADDPEPRIHRMQLTRLFAQDPFTEPYKFDGYIQCGYVAAILSSLCLNDYSTLVVPGGVYPELRETLDNRGYSSAVGAGWQTMVFELTWEPTTSATSREMFILTSFGQRTASDAYGRVGGENPVLMRLEVGEAGPGAQGVGDDPEELIPAEGHPDLYTFAGIDGDGFAFGWSQQFTIYQHNFYYGKPPEGWSFVAGDLPPF